MPLRLLALLALVCAGCTCGGEPDEAPARRDETASEGGDLGLLEPFGDRSLAPAPERFVAVEPARGEGAVRARSWAGADALRAPRGRDDGGNFLCRLWAHYGAPTTTCADGFRYVLEDTELHHVLVAQLDAGGPSLWVLGEGPDDERLARSADDLSRLLDATRPIDCSLALGDRTIGVRDERAIR